MLKILILPVLLYMHPVHVTLTSLKQVGGNDTIKVFFRMYYDDFLLDYKLYNPDVDPEKVYANQSFPVDMVNDYFNDRVRIYINNRLLKGKVLNVTVLDYEVFINLVYISDKEPKKIKIMNTVSTDLYSDQTNMIFINLNKNEHAMRLTPENEKETWTIYK